MMSTSNPPPFYGVGMMNERNMKFREMVNDVYDFLNCEDVDEQRERLDACIDFMVRLHQSWVDNDKPKVDVDNWRINEHLVRNSRWVEL